MNMKLSTSQPSEIFKNVSAKMYMINQNLVNRQKVSPEDVKRIVKLQTLRKYFFDFMELSEDKEEVRRLDKIVTQIEFQLQRLDRKSTRLNSSHVSESRMPSSA